MKKTFPISVLYILSVSNQHVYQSSSIIAKPPGEVTCQRRNKIKLFLKKKLKMATKKKKGFYFDKVHIGLVELNKQKSKVSASGV